MACPVGNRLLSLECIPVSFGRGHTAGGGDSGWQVRPNVARSSICAAGGVGQSTVEQPEDIPNRLSSGGDDRTDRRAAANQDNGRNDKRLAPKEPGCR